MNYKYERNVYLLWWIIQACLDFFSQIPNPLRRNAIFFLDKSKLKQRSHGRPAFSDVYPQEELLIEAPSEIFFKGNVHDIKISSRFNMVKPQNSVVHSVRYSSSVCISCYQTTQHPWCNSCNIFETWWMKNKKIGCFIWQWFAQKRLECTNR